MTTDCALCDMLSDSRFWGFSEIPYPPNRDEQAQSETDAQQDVRIHIKSSKYRCCAGQCISGVGYIPPQRKRVVSLVRCCMPVDGTLRTTIRRRILPSLPFRTHGCSSPLKPKVSPGLRRVALWEPELLVMLADCDAGNVVTAAQAGTQLGSSSPRGAERTAVALKTVARDFHANARIHPQLARLDLRSV